MSLAAVLLLALGTGCSSGSSESGSSEKGRVTEKPGGRAGAKASATKGTDGRPVDIVRAAVAKARATSARIDEKIVLSDGTRTYTLSIAGPFDMARDKGTLSVDFPGGAVDHIDEIFSRGRIYLTPMQPAIPKGAWASIARDKVEAHSLLRAPANDPEHVLRQIAAMRKVTRFGTGTVGGRAATRYRGSLDTATLSLGLTAKARRSLAKLHEMIRTDLPVFTDAWVDRAGRIVRVRLTHRFQTDSAEVTMTLSSFGQPVKAVAPDDSLTVPVMSVSGALPG
ncbi:LolA-like protein [Streptomyces hygroscopicus]|uniref:hypothetical protein n=1 Tax=Streptomyces hygroscopicus TaxID=1912 RepID=UPI00131AB29F|nr:hypothetical protein [Streptomyces hygroscopicus]